MSKTKAVEQKTNSVVEAKGLTKQFGEEVAVDSLTFEVPEGIIFGLIGPSGCGKTTTVRLLTGVYEPTDGDVSVLGTSPLHFTQKIRAQIGYMLQQTVLYQDLTVRENLGFASSIYGLGPLARDRLQEVLEFVELGQHQQKPVHEISGGMRRRLSLASALVHEPALLFLDEPTTGVDPVLRRKFWEHFETLRQQGRSLFVTTQYVADAEYCDQVALLQNGQLLVMDTPAGLRRRAYGGDIVTIETKDQLTKQSVDELKTLDFVRDVERVDKRTARLIVDEASTSVPSLFAWGGRREITMQSVQEYLPPFDDVFVMLVENGEKTDA
jgi:ABC-2 type transport system ATP-binding protein